MPCYCPLKGWRDAETGAWKSKASGCDVEMEVNCGSCIGCRLDRARMWAVRCVHEASLYEFGNGNCFATLTYRDRIECTKQQERDGLYIPDDWSLAKRHFQLFMKRLRKLYKDRKIKYFHCGEYGATCKHGINLNEHKCEYCNIGRPHYHALLFNISFHDLVKYNIVNGDPRYYSPTLTALWGYGFVDVGVVNFESAAYVARYGLKKITGAKADDWYTDKETGEYRLPEYCTMSNGIGQGFYNKHKSDMFPSDDVPVPGSGVFKKVPRYYEELFANEDPLTLEVIKEIRQKFREEHADQYTPQALHSKYRHTVKRLENLKRTVS